MIPRPSWYHVPPSRALVEITRPGDCPFINGRVPVAHVHAKSRLRRLYTVAKGHKLAGVRAKR